MHGIQHLMRQHTLEKQNSTDSWHSAQSNLSSTVHLQQHYGASAKVLNDRPVTSLDEGGGASGGCDDDDRKSISSSQGKDYTFFPSFFFCIFFLPRFLFFCCQF